ncbi:nuclear valosin-containing protein-like [Saccostrea echinata]|uniref:nuclear valosin-containing protein-like n=1 Tax=Saccostrea echinata TaxID=191078 RepID=UPI002A818FA2|nr:nuclear valosin-containing protein-like [Saccostrea echinata]
MMKRKLNDGRSAQNPEQKRPRSQTSYIGDPRLIPRVRQYLDAQKSKNVNLRSMAEDLQRQYGEYGRKKKNAFFKSVEKAYELIKGKEMDNLSRLEQKHLSKRRTSSSSDSDSGSDVIADDSDVSFSDDNPNYINYQDSNAMNSMMSSIYRNMSAPSTSTMPSLSLGPGPLVLDSGYRSPVSAGADACITIDDSSESDREMASTSQDSSTAFFLDRVGDQPQTKKDTDVSDPSTQGKVPNVSVCQSPAPLVEVDVQPQGSQIKEKKTGSKAEVSTKGKESEEVNSGRKTPRANKMKKSSTEGERKEKKSKSGAEVQTSSVTFADVGGNDSVLMDICKLLVHMRHPEVYRQLGIIPPRGILLHGPPGCGKTLLAHAIAGELNLPFLKIAATEIVSGVSGESEEKVRDLFEQAVVAAPCVLFIDEIDAITPKRETASKDMERRIVAQLLSCMDDLNKKEDAHVLVIGSTNRPDSLDPALRRAGRFDKEICLGIPDEKARGRILQVLCRNLTLSPDFNLESIAKNTPGYVGADLTALTREAAMLAVNRVFKNLQSHPSHLRQMCDQEVSCNSSTEKELPENQSRKTSEPETKSSDQPEICNKKDTTKSDSTKISHKEMLENIKDLSVPEKDNDSESVKDSRETLVNSKDSNSGSVDKGENSEDCSQILSTSQTSETQHRNVQSNIKDIHKGEDPQLEYLLHLLKNQPPLTGEQLQGMSITMQDFEEAIKHVQPSAKREGFATIPDVTWDDIGALKEVREDLELAILAPVRYADQFKSLGINRAQGILLSGPPGCGKTMLAKAVANESGINFISVKGPELLNMYVGESERAVRQVFQRARNSAPCVIFFDELDALCPKRSDGGESGSSVRVVNQLLTEMDGLEERKQVFIMGATNRPDIIDPAILRPGRLDKILFVGLPSADDREDILKTITKRGTRPLLADDVNLEEIAKNPKCECYTGADLAALVREASICALRTVMKSAHEGRQPVAVNKEHFDEAFVRVKPSVQEKERDKYAKMQQNLRQ